MLGAFGTEDTDEDCILNCDRIIVLKNFRKIFFAFFEILFVNYNDILKLHNKKFWVIFWDKNIFILKVIYRFLSIEKNA